MLFRRPIAIILLALVLMPAICTTAWARQDAADPVAGLAARFKLLRDSLRASNGLLAEDRPVVEAMAAEAKAISAARTDDAVAAAISLQLELWLDGDPELIDAGWSRLIAIRPADANLARSAIAWRLEAGLLDADEALAAYESLVLRFPDDETLLEAWASKLIDDTRYTQAIEMLGSRVDPETSDPAVTYRLAESYYANNRFQDAVDLLEAIEGKDTTVREYPATLSGDVGRLLERARLYVGYWDVEQALREADATADDLPRVTVVTTKGTFELELFENEAPNTVANFITLVRDGFYDGTAFHRAQPRDLIRGGDPYSREGAEGQVGTGDPGYRIAPEFAAESARRPFNDAIVMEAGVGGSTGSRFQLSFRPIDWLTQYTVFGRVISGYDVVRTLRLNDVVTSMTVKRARDHEYTVEKMAEETPGGVPSEIPSALGLPDAPTTTPVPIPDAPVVGGSGGAGSGADPGGNEGGEGDG